MSAAKQQKPRILKVVRTDSFVKILHEISKQTEQKTVPDPKEPGKTSTKEVTSTEINEITAHEAPLPAFDAALQELSDVVVNVMELGAGYKKGINVGAVSISYDKAGMRTAVISFTKSLDATGSLHPLKTPAFQIDDGKEASTGRRQCAKKHAEAVVELIKQAQRYALGERSQQLLDFEDKTDAPDAEDDKQGTLIPINSAQA